MYIYIYILLTLAWYIGRKRSVMHVLKIVDLLDVRTNYVTISLPRPSPIKYSFTRWIRTYMSVLYRFIQIYSYPMYNWCEWKVRGTEFRLWIAREWARGLSPRHMLSSLGGHTNVASHTRPTIVTSVYSRYTHDFMMETFSENDLLHNSTVWISSVWFNSGLSSRL